MGDRGNVRIEWRREYDAMDSAPTFFYTHWSGSILPSIVAVALKRGESRWDDESYLARIIFSEMIRGDVGGTTGYGIAPYETDPENPTVTVVMGGTVIYLGHAYTFAEFINAFAPRAVASAPPREGS